MTADRSTGAEARQAARVIAIARDWTGTPYIHQASRQGVGTDCLGLIRGVWRALYGAEPEIPPAYTAAWSEVSGRELLLAAAGRHLIPVAEARPGDVVIFRMRPRGPAKHAAILMPEGRILHAYSGHAVTETALTPDWARRIAGRFRFPLAPEEA